MISIGILMGGKSSRMNGFPKSELVYKEHTFLENIIIACQDYKIYYSIRNNQEHKVNSVIDRYDAIGPMGGIASLLEEIDEEAIMVLPCDHPFIDSFLIEQIISEYHRTHKNVFAYNKKIQPLIGVYLKEQLPLFKQAIENHNYKIFSLIKQFDYTTVEVDSKYLLNINTVEEYKNLMINKEL